MVNLIVIAAIIIGFVAVVVIFTPRIRRWIKSRLLKENDEPIPLFNCSIASRGDGSGRPNSEDVYDCIESKEGTEEIKT